MAEIAQDIQKLKNDSSNLEEHEKKKLANIASFQSKLTKIRKSALFLGDMSMMHEKALKQSEYKNKEIKDN